MLEVKFHITDCAFLFQVCEAAAVDDEDVRTENVHALAESVDVCNAALTRLYKDKWSYWVCSVALFLTLLCTLLLTLLCTICLEAPFSFFITSSIICIIVTVLLCFTIFMATIWNRMEVNAVRTGKFGIELVRSNLEGLKFK
jgi:sphingomyelin phosphodiesterase 2